MVELMRGERGSFASERRYRRKDASEFWGHLRVSLARDTRCQPTLLIALLTDAGERERGEEHLREAEKNNIAGCLAGGIAEDLNQLLSGILLYCDRVNAALQKRPLEEEKLERTRVEQGKFATGRRIDERRALEELATETGETSGLRERVEDVRLVVEQGVALTQQLLAIARKRPAETHPIAINQIVMSTKNLLCRLLGERIELVTALDSAAGLVLADEAQLRQIVLNLVLNARDALPQGGKIRVITRASELPREVEPARARPAVSLTVTDNGCGMDAETRSRIFEPFSNDRKRRRAGLGLAMVQRIVTDAGGTIMVESEPGRGTSIEVFIPLATAASAYHAPGRL